jgi:hypothetical protein
MPHRRTVPGVLVALLLCAPLLLAPPAAAKVIDRGVIQEEYSETVDDWCGQEGLSVDVQGVVHIRFKVTSQGRQRLVHFHDNVSVDETHTANGVTTRYVERTLFKDLKVTDNGDGTLTIVVLATGNATLYGPDGKAIARGPGQVRFRLVVDHAGTPTDPDDDQVISFEQIKGSTGRNDDFCPAELAVFG